MKNWAAVGILAAAIIGFLLIGTYQDMLYDADGQDITEQIPWNGMRPWDGSPSVS